MFDFNNITDDDINKINDNYNKLIFPKEIDETKVANIITEYSKKI